MMLVLTLIVLFSVGIYADFEGISLEECGSTKGCFRPSTCPDQFCEYGATWRLVDVNGLIYVEFELLGNVKSSDGFISLAFSKNAYFVSVTVLFV